MFQTVLLPILRRFTGAAAFRDVSVLVSGTGLAQAIQLLATPLLLRLYDPALFGIYSICNWIAAVLAVLLTFRLEVVIPVSLRLTFAARTLGALRIVSLVLFVLQLVVLFASYRLLQSWFERIGGDLVLLFLVTSLALAQAWFLAYRALLMRQGLFRPAATGLVVRATVFAAAAVVLAILRPLDARLDTWGLLIAQALADWTAVVLFAAAVPRRLRKVASILRFKRMFDTVARSRHLFGAISLGHTISTVNQSLPTWIAGALYGAEMAGWLSLAQRLTMGPAQLISTSVGGLVSRRITMLRRAGQAIHPFLVRIILKATAVSAPLFLVLAILAPLLTGPVFGEQWRDAGLSVSIIAGVGFVALIYGAIEGVPILFQMSRFLLSWHVLRLALLGGGYFAASKLDLTYTQWLVVFASGEFFLYALFCLASVRAANVSQHANAA